MDRVYLREGATGAVKQLRHVLAPPAFTQPHKMRMHLGEQQFPPALYDRDEQDAAGDAFAVNDCDEGERAPYSDNYFMEELRGMYLFDSIRAAPPDPNGEAVVVRGGNIPWDCGEHPALGKGHNVMSSTLHAHHVHPHGSRSPSPE